MHLSPSSSEEGYPKSTADLLRKPFMLPVNATTASQLNREGKSVTSNVDKLLEWGLTSMLRDVVNLPLSWKVERTRDPVGQPNSVEGLNRSRLPVR